MSGLLVHKDVEKLELTFERELPASPRVVWESWTTKQGLEAWWGPEGWSTVVRSLDVRPGGLWHFGMGPAGESPQVWVRSIYSEVITAAALSYVEGFSDETGADLDPESNAVTVEFFGLHADRSRLVLHTRFTSAERLRRVTGLGIIPGWTAGFDRLENYLELGK